MHGLGEKKLTILPLGLMAMPRTPIVTMEEEEEASFADDQGGVVDASLLPPG